MVVLDHARAGQESVHSPLSQLREPESDRLRERVHDSGRVVDGSFVACDTSRHVVLREA